MVQYNWKKITLLAFPGEGKHFFFSQIQKYHPQSEVDLVLGGEIWKWYDINLQKNIFFAEFEGEFFLFPKRWIPLMTLSHIFILLIDPFKSEKDKAKIKFLIELLKKNFVSIPILALINQNGINHDNTLQNINLEFGLQNSYIVDYNSLTLWDEIWQKIIYLLNQSQNINPIRSLDALDYDFIKYSFPLMKDENEFFCLPQNLRKEIQSFIEPQKVNFDDIGLIYIYNL